MQLKILGRAEYQEAWELQKKMVEERRLGLIGDTLLLLEHPPVYTRGLSAKTPAPRGLPRPHYLVERGGDWTYHGPGQLVGYPIVNLAERGLRVGEYLRLIERALIRAVQAFGLKAATLPGLTGVWCKGRKIASIGIAVKRGVSYHGFSLNVSCDLAGFKPIYPCKLEPEVFSNLETLLERPVSMREIQSRVGESFQAALEQGVLVAPAASPS